MSENCCKGGDHNSQCASNNEEPFKEASDVLGRIAEFKRSIDETKELFSAVVTDGGQVVKGGTGALIMVGLVVGIRSLEHNIVAVFRAYSAAIAALKAKCDKQMTTIKAQEAAIKKLEFDVEYIEKEASARIKRESDKLSAQRASMEGNISALQFQLVRANKLLSLVRSEEKKRRSSRKTLRKLEAEFDKKSQGSVKISVKNV